MQVDILMATYNGANYIREQIDSIIGQSHKDWRLLVRDDGSSDETCAIVEEYAQKDARIELVDQQGESLGVAKNFIKLLDYSTAPYAMFCDQDDVWFAEKVDTMLKVIERYDQTIPQVLFSNAYLWNPEQGILSNQNTLTYPKNFKELLFLNTGIQGAASIFNHAMVEAMRIPLEYYAMHDHVLVLCGMALGEVHYLDKPLFYYRQHEENVTGNAPGSLWKKFTLALTKNREIAVVDAHHYKGLSAFYMAHKDELKRDDCKTIEEFLLLPSLSTVQRFSRVIHHHYKIFGSTGMLLAKMCVRPFYG